MIKTNSIRITLSLLFVTTFFVAEAQRQLVLVSGDEVVYRFVKGDTFRSKWKTGKTEHWGFLVEIDEFSVITSQDTIPLRRINKVLLSGRPLAYRIGKKLVTIGIGLFVIDQFNQTIIQDRDLSIDSGIAKTSIVLTAAGLPLMFFRKNWKKLHGTMRLMSVGRDSRFYLPN